jgi:hypothetical protein
MKIFCLGVAGRAMTEKLTEVLFYNAHDMIESGKGKQRVKGKDYDGVITTKFDRVALSSISGIFFEATVMTAKGETKAKYIVRDQDLEGIEQAKFHIVDRLDPEEPKNEPKRIPSPSNN